MTTTDGKLLVLIVEDIEDLAGVMQITLRRMGIESYHASDGYIALDYLAENTPDLVLLDIGLPGMSGWEVLEQIKASMDEIPFPIIILTAFNDPANRLIGKLQKYVTQYVTKPFEVETLRKAVRGALQLED
ncbi:MAG: response regulator [Burkholderiales bacterium]|nr:response regulator [Anaerolineae bacterium]